MCSLEPFKIDLKGLKDGDTTFEFSLDDGFFEAVGSSEVHKGKVCVGLLIHKVAERYFDLDFHIEGEVIVPCDRCLDDIPQDIKTDTHLVARFGEDYSEKDELVIVDENEGIIDISWFVYEFVVLNIPIKHVHAPGKCNRAMIEMLTEHYSATRSSGGVDEKTIDPRWIELLKLKN